MIKKFCDKCKGEVEELYTILVMVRPYFEKCRYTQEPSDKVLQWCKKCLDEYGLRPYHYPQPPEPKPIEDILKEWIEDAVGE